MTTLTAFQNAATEAIWNKLEDANEVRGSLTAALQDRLGTLDDFFARYFAQDDSDIQAVRTALTTVAENLGQNLDALADEMMEINIFDTIDTVVKEDMDGDEDDANAVQNMIAEQHWIALTAELRYLASTNNDNATINKMAEVLDNTQAQLLGALYA